jgi:antitoxin VapB
MTITAKIFVNGRSQAVRLPAAYRFDTKEVFIRQDAETGDVILSRKPPNWDGFFAARKAASTAGEIPDNFLDKNDRNQDQGAHRSDPFEGWRE